MSALRVVLVASLVAASLAAPLLAVSTAATDGESIQPAARTLQAEANNTSQATVGEQISGFMQEQTSQADGAVESGMWSAAYENAGDGSQRAALVDQRTEGLAADIAALQAERRELIEAKQAGNISALEFRSQMSRLTGQYASLLTALDETEPRAEEVGANVSTIQDLRGAATEAVGPAVASAARNGTVSPPGLSNNTTVGPPVDVPGQDNTTEVGNGVIGNGPVGDVPGGNGSDENDTAGDGDGLGDDVGNGNGVGNGTVGEGIGDGNGIGPGNGNGNGNGIGNGHSFDLPNLLADAS